MNKRRIVCVLLTSGALVFGIGMKTPSTHNKILLSAPTQNVQQNDNNNAQLKNKKEQSTNVHISSNKAQETNTTLSKKEVENLKNKKVKAYGMEFSGLKAVKIAPGMQGNEFLATPGFNADGFASSVNENLYNYELNLNNDQQAMKEAINLNGGNPVDTCVFFQSSALRGIGQNVPQSIGYTTHLENWLNNNGWTRHTNFAYLQKGDLCFASYYHTFLFMGWKDKAQGIAWVMGNESYVQPYYRHRNLNGQSPAIYGDNSYYQATCYWTYGNGYEGPSKNPVHGGGYNAIGLTQVVSATPLYQNQGSGEDYGYVPNNTSLPVIASDNGWYQVYYNGNMGWINSSNTNGLAESMGGGSGTANTVTGSNIGGPYKNIQPTTQPSIGTGVVIATGGLWLNENPSLSNPNGIEIMPEGANISVIETDGAWDKIQYNGQVGWAYAQYLQTMMSPSTPSPAQPNPNQNQSSNSNTNNQNQSQSVSALNGTTQTTTSIYLNNQPESTNQGATALATIPNGTTVQVVGQTSNGWYKVVYNGQTGYIESTYTTGYAAKITTGFVNSNGSLSFYDNGQLQTGWINYDGQGYYANSQGVIQTGWQNLDGYWRYFNTTTGAIQKGVQTIDGMTYLFDEHGAMYTGFTNINGNTYYIGQDHNEYTGSHTIDGINYTFDNSGKLVKEVKISTLYNPSLQGWQTINNKDYYYGNDGYAYTGWHELDGYWRYFNTTTGAIEKGVQTIDGMTYLFDKHGAMYTGFTNINGNTYYIGQDHNEYTGTHIINGTTYVFNNNGVLISENSASNPLYRPNLNGWQTIDGNTYFFNNEGYAYTGWHNMYGYWRYFNPKTGAIETGSQVIDGKQYLFDENGAMYSGIVHINGELYHISDVTHEPVSGWANLWGRNIYSNSNGKLNTGWNYMYGYWRYFDPTTGGLLRGKQVIDGKTYLFDKHGAMYTGFVNIDGSTYYIGNDHKEFTGIHTINGQTYNFGTNGILQN